MSSPPHPLMHLGMTGKFKIRGQKTMYYESGIEDSSTEWPPKYWKFNLETAEEPKVAAAFTDSRRFARIRLIDCPADQIRKVPPLVQNGPDPVVDKDILTEEWLAKKVGGKHVPIKALLLDQANISGIGNWVGDEIMYDARMHPEQYSDTLSAAQIKQLHKSLHYVCSLAVDTLADKSKFPEGWLFKHRWGKGKKDKPTKLPNGSKFVYLTVGGRTSCVVPSVQKKTGPVAGDITGDGKASMTDDEETASTKKKSTTKSEKKAEDVKPEPTSPTKSRTKGVTKRKSESTAGSKDQSEEKGDDDAENERPGKNKKQRTSISAPASKSKKKDTPGAVNKVVKDEKEKVEANTGRRRSTRSGGK